MTRPSWAHGRFDERNRADVTAMLQQHGRSPAHVDPDSGHGLCGICPALWYPRERFVIFDRPCREVPFNSVDGHRYTAAGEPACVPPGKIGLAADRVAAPTDPSVADTPASMPTRWWPWPQR